MSESMLLLALITITVAPASFLCLRYAVATHFAVQQATLVRCFVFGIISILPVLLWTHIAQPLMPKPESYIAYALWRACMQAAVPEEAAKFFMLAVVCIPRYGLPSRAAGMAMGATVALGFATFENVLYVFDEGFTTGLLRAFTSVPGHAGMGAIMGYFLARGVFLGRRRDLALAMLLPVIIHTFYNFPLMVQADHEVAGGSFAFSILILTLLILWVRLLMRRERQLDKRLDANVRYLVPPLPSNV